MPRHTGITANHDHLLRRDNLQKDVAGTIWGTPAVGVLMLVMGLAIGVYDGWGEPARHLHTPWPSRCFR